MRIDETLTPGATPTMPLPSLAAAIDPATCVPCSPTGRQAPGRVSSFPYAQDADLAASKFALRSGCWSSTPVSSTPTVIAFEPGFFSQALSAPIWVMSDRGTSGDVSGSSRGAGGIAGLAAAGGTSEVRVAPTFWTPLTVRILVAKSAVVEWTTSTPIASYAAKTEPPLAVTAPATVEVWFGAVITKYERRPASARSGAAAAGTTAAASATQRVRARIRALRTTK